MAKERISSLASELDDVKSRITEINNHIAEHQGHIDALRDLRTVMLERRAALVTQIKAEAVTL